MALVINTNLGSINGQRNLNGSGIAQATAMQRLSSGVRVNSAKDDAAGLAIADRMSSQIRGMTVAVRNANDGISLTQTAEGALGSLTDTLQRMRDLAVQSSSNAGVSDSDRSKMQTEFKALNDELKRVIQNSEFNGKKVLNGDLESGLNIQVGATTDTNSRISVAISNMSTLLTPVSRTTLYPTGEAMDSTLAAKVTEIGTIATNDTQLVAANSAAKLANAAVVAAKAAAASPNDLALAKAASAANLAAANAIQASSVNITATADANLGTGLVSNAFNINVHTADTANTAVAASIVTSDAAVQAKVQGTDTTSYADASSMLTTATQLAAAATAGVEAAGKNIFASAMNTITGDTLQTTSAGGSILDLTLTNYPANSLNADRNAQKALAGLAIAKNIAGASYIQDATKTQTANETDKLSFINNNKLVVENTISIGHIGTDYSLSAIDTIDTAIAAIDTQRSNLGSTQNRFTTTVANLQNGIENQSAAKSRIMDADFAQETANLSRAQILQAAGTAMLAQANQTGQTVMTLLR